MANLHTPFVQRRFPVSGELLDCRTVVLRDRILNLVSMVRAWAMVVAIGLMTQLSSTGLIAAEPEVESKTDATLESTNETSEGLRDGWKLRKRIREVKLGDHVVARESQLIVVVEKGWLVVRRITNVDDVEWQIVLARAIDPTKPQIKIDDSTGKLEVRYRGFFVRESLLKRLRILREQKPEDSPEWPKLSLSSERQETGGGMSANVSISQFASDQWCWIESGPPNRPDLWVRLQPTTVRIGEASRGNAISGVNVPKDGPIELFYGDSQIQDDGDLFVGTRQSFDVADQGLEDVPLDRWMKRKKAHPLTAKEWFNVEDPLSLEDLKGQVVLLVFWAQSCKVSVKQLADVERIHKKLANRGLTVIGVHSNEICESMTSFLIENRLTFPIMIDDAQTVESYGVGALPNYFLIDRNGKAVWGFGMAPPAEWRIEKLLK